MTVPLVNELPGGVLHPGTNIVEFLPYGESPEARLLLQPWQLEAGEKYEVILTTSMGLLRYRLHDVVQCHGFYNRSPIIEFCHKTEFVLRLGQVSIDEKQLCNALGRIEVEINEDIMIGPNANGDALTIYLKEQIEDERQIDMAKKLERFDHLLGEELVVYRQDREVGDLKPVELVMLAHNHQAWQRPDHMQSKSRLLVPTPLSQL